MKVLDLPFPLNIPSLPTAAAQRLLMSSDPVSVRERTLEILAGELDSLNYSYVATRPGGSSGESVRASIARADHQLDEASRLVCQRYAWRGYATDPGDGRRAFETRFGVTLIAETAGAIVGTMSVGLDGPGGLSVDDGYLEALSAARAEGRRLCELTRLALAERADTRTVLSTLFAFAYSVAMALQDVTDVFIEVNPRHVGFYQRVLGFVVAAGERVCERVQAPAVLLRASVDELEARLGGYCDAVINHPDHAGSTTVRQFAYA